MTDTNANNNCIGIQAMRQAILEAVPPLPRLEDISPYTNSKASEPSGLSPGEVLYTQRQLDMRRKYEILQYRNNGNVNGSITKKQQFSKLITNKTRFTKTVKTEDSFVIYSTNSCPDDETVVVPTTSSDVPGPSVMLYYEPNVPLYNYGSNNLNYAIISDDVENNRTAKIDTYSNISLTQQFTNVLKLTFLSDIAPSNNIRINIPTKLVAYGTKIDSASDSQVIIGDIDSILKRNTRTFDEQTILSKNIFTLTNLSENVAEVEENFMIYIESTGLKLSRGNIITLDIQSHVSTKNLSDSNVSLVVNSDESQRISFEFTN